MKPNLEVLLVEDDEDNAFLIALTLERIGARVHTAATLRQAVELASHRFDLLVSDVHLPDGDGADLLAGWPRDRQKPRAVALTGDSDDETRQRLSAAGFDIILQKPVLPEMLLERIRQLLEPQSK